MTSKQMVRNVHIILGLLWGMAYVWIMTHDESLLPHLKPAMENIWGRGASGGIFVIVLPLFPVFCFLFPDLLSGIFSSKEPFSGRPVLTRGIWYMAGYFFMLVSAGVLALYGPA